MSETIFLAHFPDPFDVSDSRYLVRYSDGRMVELTARELSDTQEDIATYEVEVLVDDLRRAGVSPPKGLISINDAIRLAVGLARDEGGERRWNIWDALGAHFSDRQSAKTYVSVVRSKELRPEPQDIRKLLEEGAIAVAALWDQTVAELRDRGELERFSLLEVPVQRIFFARQSAGIPVAEREAERLLRVVGSEKYTAYAKVAEILGRSPAGLSFWNIQPYLSKTDVGDLAEEEDGGRLRDMFKLAASRSTFARSFLAYCEASRDEGTLRRALTESRRLYPEFRTHGTVTSRILVSDPLIQQLKRRYRGIVSAEDRRTLAYMDYAQFEPGILAFLSGDEGLIAAYNQGDLYTALSVALYSSPEHRDLSKRIFLAYSYGMTGPRIARLLLGADVAADIQDELVTKISLFFSAYPRLDDFRQEMHRGLEQQGYVESLWGNRRWRTTEGELTLKEKRWAVNHPVQATASLVFKEALVGLHERFGSESMLLPMHDAVLLQLHSDDIESQVAVAREIMLQAYARRCPSIRPRVTATDFCGGAPLTS